MFTFNKKRTPQKRRRNFTLLGALAQFALVLGILLGRLDLPNLDFLIGTLYGFSMVGNLTFLIVVVRQRDGGEHD